MYLFPCLSDDININIIQKSHQYAKKNVEPDLSLKFQIGHMLICFKMDLVFHNTMLVSLVKYALFWINFVTSYGSGQLLQD